jgi:hypothetical protein
VVILLLKLLLTPLLIAVVTVAGRRWGAVVSGLLVGLPLTSGPVSLFLALQYGTEFASRAAVGNLAGQASVCAFCLAFSLMAPRFGWPVCAVVGLLAFLAATALWSLVAWPLWAAALLVLAAIAVSTRLIPRSSHGTAAPRPPGWDLPARMAIASAFVLVLTTVAGALGPQLAGMLAPFPTFAVVLGSFTLRQQGPPAAAALLRGVTAGSLGYMVFFLIVGLLLTRIGLAGAYLFATAAALSTNGVHLAIDSAGRDR